MLCSLGQGGLAVVNVAGDGELMENRMADLINNVIIPRLPYRLSGISVNVFARRKVSLYILTDGNWAGSSSTHGAGVQTPVRSLVEELKRRRLNRTQISLHCVRSGENESGRRILEWLDNSGPHDL